MPTFRECPESFIENGTIFLGATACGLLTPNQVEFIAASVLCSGWQSPGALSVNFGGYSSCLSVFRCAFAMRCCSVRQASSSQCRRRVRAQSRSSSTTAFRPCRWARPRPRRRALQAVTMRRRPRPTRPRSVPMPTRLHPIPPRSVRTQTQPPDPVQPRSVRRPSQPASTRPRLVQRPLPRERIPLRSAIWHRRSATKGPRSVTIRLSARSRRRPPRSVTARRSPMPTILRYRHRRSMA